MNLDSIRRARAFPWSLLVISIAGAVAAFVLTYVFMCSLSTRIETLRTYVAGLPDKSSDHTLPAADDELGALAAALRQTALHIRDLMGNLKLEGSRRDAILASMVEGVLAVDQELRVIFCNDSFARSAGVASPVPEGVPVSELVRDPALIEILVEVIYTGRRVNRRVQLKAAQAHSFEVQAAPLAGPTARGALAILHDVTDIERLERIRKDFVANVSHELRTPLASIRGYAETLLDGALEDPDHNRKFLETIHSEAIRLSDISSDLLTLSELEAAGVTPPLKSISARASVEAAVRAVEESARVREVSIVTGSIEDVQVWGHRLRLEQVLINLLDNAVKFNRLGGQVQVEARVHDNDHIAIAVSDTGAGIPSSDLPRIFERFYRVDRARSRAVGGTGLGLSIVKHAMEQMGGSVRVESELGAGSRFTLLIPIAR